MRFLFFFLVPFFLSSCGLNNAVDAGEATNAKGVSGKLGFQSFSSNVYPILNQKCGSCHGGSQFPLFAQSNVEAAYAAALSKFAINQPSQSPLLQKSKDSHCGVNCTGSGSELQAALEAWAAAELTEPVGSESGNQRPPAGTLNAQDAFEVSLYPLLLNNCASCHSSRTSPLFAVQDVSLSYTRTRSRMNFQSFTESTIYRQATNSHSSCQSCTSANSGPFLEAIEYWAASE